MIVALEQYVQDVAALKNKLSEIAGGLHLEDLEKELSELREEMNADGFWDNLERSTHVNRRIAQIEGKIKHYESLCQGVDDLEVMIELAQEENDESMVGEIGEELSGLTEKVEALELETLMRGDYDNSNAILSLHAGAGGTEAQDWTQMLYRMYTRYCEKLGFKVKLLDYLEGDEAGIKSVSFEVDGDNAYGYLRG